MKGLGQADALGPLVPGRPPDMMALQNYNVNRAGQPEVIWQPQYDYQVYPMAGATQFTFFQTTIGAGGTTRADTSMTAAGQMSRPIEFLITGIQVYFRPGNTVAKSGVASTVIQENWNDVNKIMYAADSWLELFIGSKAYLDDGPIGKFPGLFGVTGGGWSSSSSANATNVGDRFIDFAKASGRYYTITPVKLPANQNFNVTLNFPALLTASVAGTIGVILDGFLYRLSQ